MLRLPFEVAELFEAWLREHLPGARRSRAEPDPRNARRPPQRSALRSPHARRRAPMPSCLARVSRRPAARSGSNDDCRGRTSTRRSSSAIPALRARANSSRATAVRYRTRTLRAKLLAYTRVESRHLCRRRARDRGTREEDPCHGRPRQGSSCAAPRPCACVCAPWARVGALACLLVGMHDIEGRRDPAGRDVDTGQRVDRPAEEAPARGRRNRGGFPRLRAGASRRRTGASGRGTDSQGQQHIEGTVQDLRRAGIHGRDVPVVRAEHRAGQRGGAARRCCSGPGSPSGFSRSASATSSGSTATPGRPTAAAVSPVRRGRAAPAASVSAGGKRNPDYVASVWDLQNATEIGTVTTDVTGTSVLIGAIAPIPIISPGARARPATGSAKQLRSFLEGGDMTTGSPGTVTAGTPASTDKATLR